MQENSTESSGPVTVLSRKEAKLSESLERRLKAYVLAAGAAGAILAAPTAANADIITAPGLSYLFSGSPPGRTFFTNDLTVNGITDFRLFGSQFGSVTGGGNYWELFEGAGAQLVGINGGGLTGLLGKGVEVGHGRNFDPGVDLGRAGLFIDNTRRCTQTYPSYRCTTHRSTRRSAAALGSGYLGLRFLVDGQPHYGWARVNARAGNYASVSGTLGPIAYDTVAGQAILTGQTTPTPEPATLSLLALGAAALGIWRSKKQKAA